MSRSDWTTPDRPAAMRPLAAGQMFAVARARRLLVRLFSTDDGPHHGDGAGRCVPPARGSHGRGLPGWGNSSSSGRPSRGSGLGPSMARCRPVATSRIPTARTPDGPSTRRPAAFSSASGPGVYAANGTNPTAAPTVTDAPTTTNAPTRTETYAPTRMTEAPSLTRPRRTRTRRRWRRRPRRRRRGCRRRT